MSVSFFDFKDFLTLQEVGEYLFEKDYPKFDRDRLIVFVKDLINEHKLSVAIYYKGDVGTELSFRDKDKTNDPDRECYINTYAWLDFNIAHALFKNSSTIKYGISRKDIGDYRFNITPNIKDYKNILDHENEAYHCYLFIENDDYKLTLDDVRYYRPDLDKLFNEKNSELKCINDELADDEPTHHKSVGSMQALVTTLIKMAEYDKADLADPYGELNKLIQAKAEVLGLSVKKDFIAKWLKKADDVL